MRSRISENESLKKVFSQVYSATGRGEPGEEWQSQVMRRIRQIGPLRSASGFWPAFENTVWRLAPVSCLLVFVLTFFLANMEFDANSDYLGTLALELELPSLVGLFGFEG